ncbi:putative uncharacterized protein [Helicobacter pylori]|uniref:hypothetical protein n=1 Tax=Helicobacter pylori TaxID=210 RepID=UPI00095849F3|nr:hypothetical protein [Helicobacter pylori]BAW52270.1 putative uncharacterized protein [Helicobacter pylori]
MRLSYDFLEPTNELPKYFPTPKELGRKFKAEVEVAKLARQNRPRFRVKDNLFSDSSDGGVRGYGSIGSRIEAIYRIYRISHTAHITFSLDEIERWEKEHLEQGLGNSFKPKKKKETKAKRKK